MLNLPNMLSLVRIFVIPVFMFVYYIPFPWAHPVAAWIFGFACATDALDGYLARRFHLSTRFGAFLDPVADKLMVCIALVMVVAEYPLQVLHLPGFSYAPTFMFTIPVGIIISREIVVSALREWMAEIGKRTSVRVSQVGKVKTGVQMWALFFLIYGTPTSSARLLWVGYILLCIAAVLTVWSMMIYLKAAWPEFHEKHDA